MRRTTILVFLVSVLSAFAQISADENTPNLPGHGTKDADYISPRFDIVTAKFLFLGNPGSDASGSTYYERARIQIITSFQGNLSGQIKVSYTAIDFPPEHKDVMPSLGAEYILFIRDNKNDPDDYELDKILPCTAHNLASIKALIESKESR